MRSLEKLLILALAGALLAGDPWTLVLAIAAAAICVLHAFIEKPRWQMIPAYLSVAVLPAWLPANRIPPLVALIVGMALAMGVAISFVLPVFALPEPGGPCAIGTETRQWTALREDGAGGRRFSRPLTVQFWYPSDTRGGKCSLYRVNDAPGLKSHLRLVRTHSFVNAALSGTAEKFPLILFSPGWKGHLTQNTVQFEMLASHGFIVVSIEHPRAEALPADFDSSLEANLRGYDREVELRAGDIEFVINRLESLEGNDAEGRFTGRLDLRRIGMFGFSFGGAVTAQACWRDRRLKAGLNLDGLLFGQAADAGVEQPFFFMSSDGALPAEQDLHDPDPKRRVHMRALDGDMKRIRKSLAQFGGYYLRIAGANHSNFSDQPLYSPLRRLTGAGRMVPARAFQIVNDYTLAFFEHHLNEKPEPLLDAKMPRDAEADFSRYLVGNEVEAIA